MSMLSLLSVRAAVCPWTLPGPTPDTNVIVETMNLNTNSDCSLQSHHTQTYFYMHTEASGSTYMYKQQVDKRWDVYICTGRLRVTIHTQQQYNIILQHYSGCHLLPLLHKLFNAIIALEDIPSFLKLGVIVPCIQGQRVRSVDPWQILRNPVPTQQPRDFVPWFWGRSVR